MSLKRKSSRGGAPKDGIPAIDEPTFFSSGEAIEFFTENEQALIVSNGNESRAYPISILNWHEIVNDTVGGMPLSITYCPLCGTGIVFNATVDGEVLSFGVSGLLYQSNVMLYDRQSSSLWSQIMRNGVSGKYKGKMLEVFTSTQENLHHFLAHSPNTRVLAPPKDISIRRNYKRDPYVGYALSPRVFFPIKSLDLSIPLKTWCLLALYRDEALIVPLSHLDPVRRRDVVSLGDLSVPLAYNIEERTIRCTRVKPDLVCITGYWFALKAFYPEAQVYSRK